MEGFEEDEGDAGGEDGVGVEGAADGGRGGRSDAVGRRSDEAEVDDRLEGLGAGGVVAVGEAAGEGAVEGVDGCEGAGVFVEGGGLLEEEGRLLRVADGLCRELEWFWRWKWKRNKEINGKYLQYGGDLEVDTGRQLMLS